MTWTLTTSAACIDKAGHHVNDDLRTSGAVLARWCDQAEAAINTRTRKDWVADYATVTANFKEVLSDVASDMIAMKMIAYDIANYSSQVEAQTMLDMYRDNINLNIAALEKDKHQSVML